MISQPAIKFLQDLHKNNTDKEWFRANQPRYKAARQEFKDVLYDWAVSISGFDSSIDPDNKNSIHVFRINNDLRFNPKRPIYKSNFGAEIYPPNKPKPKAGYYLSIEPGGNSFFGGGLYMPSNDILRKIRTNISEKPFEIDEVLTDKNFKKVFKDISRELTLKQMPRDSKNEEENQDLIKLKSFHAGIGLDDKLITGKNLMTKLTEYSRAISPLVRWLNGVV